MSKHPSSAHRYPRNSPHAAARIVALTLISNGGITASELAVLEAMQAHEQPGTTRRQELLEPLLYGLDFQVVPRGRRWL